MVDLYDVINAGYKDPIHQKNTLAKHGFIRDNDLSNANNQTYYNPTQKKLIYNTTGTHNATDWGTNMYLMAGKLKNTQRYQDAHTGLRSAKLKYNVNDAIISGDSLGGKISSLIGSKSDKIHTLNKASVIGEKKRSNETNWRVSGDPVSILNKNTKHGKTLRNQNMMTPFSVINAYKAHIPSSIKKHYINI